MVSVLAKIGFAQGQTVAPKDLRNSVDIVTVKPGLFAYPLRHAGVVPGSESVDLGGKTLVAGRDYVLDSAAGTLALRTRARVGESLVVSYQYSASAPQTTSSATGSNAFGLNFSAIPDRLGFNFGMGIAERTADGTVATSNVFGLGNNFSSGSSKLKGRFLHSDRTSFGQVDGSVPTSGNAKAQFIDQMFQTAAFGGGLSLNYRSIGNGFSGFSQLRGGDYSDSEIGQLQREIGLRRTGFTANGLNFGGLKFSGADNRVMDSGKGIRWQQYSLKQGSSEFSFSNRSVDTAFSRFGDLGEQDRDALSREAGMNFRSLGFKSSQLNFSQNVTQDQSGNAIQRQSIAMSHFGLNLQLSNQSIDSGFNRFGSLRDEQRGQWSREAGLSRNNLSLQSKSFGFSTEKLSTAQAGAQRLDTFAQWGGLRIDHLNDRADTGFNMLPNLAAEELDRRIKRIGELSTNGYGYNPGLRGVYAGAAGLDRSWTNLSFAEKGRSFGFRQGAVEDGNNRAASREFSVQLPGVKAQSFRSNIDSGFNRIWNLMDFERSKFGFMSGLRTGGDSLSLSHGNRSFEFSRLMANIGESQAGRTKVGWSSPGLSFSANWRNVDSSFTNAGQLVDPEAGVLAQLIGRSQRDLSLSWNPNQRFGFSGNLNQVRNLSTGELLTSEQRRLQLGLDRKNQLSIEQARTFQGIAGLDPVMNFSMTRLGWSSDFGANGKLSLSAESANQGGKLSILPSYQRAGGLFERSFGSSTKLRLETDQYRYANGEQESVQNMSIEHRLTKNFGLSASSNRVDRYGQSADQTNRSLGFWLDLGGGVVLRMGQNRQLNGTGNGTINQNWSLSGGSLGFLNVGQSGYQDDRIDASRTQSNSNWSVQTGRGLNFGVLKNLRFSLAGDARNASMVTQVENRQYGVSGEFLGAKVGMDYRSQLDPGSQQRAAVRGYHLEFGHSNTFIAGKFDYRLRTLPNGASALTRSYDLAVNMGHGLRAVNQMVTLPEQQNGGILLGSQNLNFRKNEWKVTKDGLAPYLTYTEQFLNGQLSRISGFGSDLAKIDGIPSVTFFYGMEQSSQGSNRAGSQRFSFTFTPKQGPNQAFSMSFTNLSRVGVVPNPGSPVGVSLQLEYRLRF